MSLDLGQKGRDNVLGFFRGLKTLLKGNGINFDLIIGCGDSGIAMVKLAEIVYQKLDIDMPPKLLIPFYRYTKKDVPRGEEADNSILVGMVKRQLSNLDKLENILFVDDEIGVGRTIKGIMSLVVQANQTPINNKSILYVLAEDHGWPPEEQMKIRIKFLPFAFKKRGINNAISYVIPDEFERPIKERYADEQHGPKERMNVLLNLPIKTTVNGMPQWSDEWQKQLETEIPEFAKLQKGFSDYLDNLLEKSLQHA